MTTADKDFKVKNGLVVTDGGTFGGPVVVSTPTQDNHAATKLYVDSNAGGGGGGYTVSDTAPGSPSEGDVWFRSTDAKEFIYYDSYWVELVQGPQGEQGIQGIQGVPGPSQRVLLHEQSLTGVGAVTLSNISQNYDELIFVAYDFVSSSWTTDFLINGIAPTWEGAQSYGSNESGSLQSYLQMLTAAAAFGEPGGYFEIRMPDYTRSDTIKVGSFFTTGYDPTRGPTGNNGEVYNVSFNPITSLVWDLDPGETFTSGTIRLYGVNW